MRTFTTEDESDRPLARFASPTGSETVLAVCSDPHLTPTERGTTKVYHRTEARFRAVLEDATAQGADAIVCTGDLTKDGEAGEFDLVDRVVAGSDLPFFAVPGNHDVPKAFDDHDAPPVERFVERYTPGTLPYRVQIGDADLLCLDSASGEGLADEHGGRVAEGQSRWLEAALVETDRRGTTPIVVTHHPVAPVELPAFEPRDHYRLHDAEDVIERLGAHDVPLVLSGHVHWPFCWEREGLRQVVTPAASSYPQAYLLVEITPAGTRVRMRPLADREGMAEAYSHAREGGARGRAMVESADAGYFEGLPLADERPIERRAR